VSLSIHNFNINSDWNRLQGITTTTTTTGAKGLREGVIPIPPRGI